MRVFYWSFLFGEGVSYSEFFFISHETLRRRADLGAAIGLKMVVALRFVQALAQWPGPAISIAAVSFLIYFPP